MINDLLKVKEIREKAAHNEVIKCHLALEEAEQEKKDATHALENYIDWRCKEEQSLYDNILNTNVRQRDLDLLKQKVAALREKDAELEQRVEVAKNGVDNAKQALSEARQAHQHAVQAVEKFEAFSNVLDEAAAKESQRLEDIEMEEFSTKTNR